MAKNMNDVIKVTQAGLEKWKTELDELITVRRAEVAEELKEARSYGDLSENAEYDAAKDAQAKLEERISYLENQIKNAEIVTEEELNSGKVNLSHTVKVQYIGGPDDGDVENYTIVGSNESDPLNNRISNESPIGRGLLGAEKGQEIAIELPENSVITLKILDFWRD